MDDACASARENHTAAKITLLNKKKKIGQM